MEFLQQDMNFLWLALAVCSGGLLLWNTVRGDGDGLSPQDAVHFINRQHAVVVDLRDADDFVDGHLVNARNIPAKELESRLAELEKFKKRPIIVYGGNPGKAVQILLKAGFEKAIALAGGLPAWTEAGMPVEK